MGIVIAGLPALALLPSTGALSALVVEAPAVDDDVVGGFAPLPLIPCLLVTFGETGTNSACAIAGNPDSSCPAGFPPATGEDVSCQTTFANQRVDAMVLYYGGPDSDHPTSGANHNSLSHDSDSHGMWWYVDYFDGAAPREDCNDFLKTGARWHGSQMDGLLSEDTSSPAPNIYCYTGPAEGYWGAGVRFR